MENNKIKSRRIRSKGIVRKIKTTQKQDIGLDTYFHPKKTRSKHRNQAYYTNIFPEGNTNMD